MKIVKTARMSKLQKDIRAGIDSGDAGTLDAEQIKRNARDKLHRADGYFDGTDQAMPADLMTSVRTALTTTHDPALMLRDGLLRHRKVLGSMHVEWLQVPLAEFAIDQLIAMYRDACSDRTNAIAEIERVQAALQREQLHVAELKKLNDSYRESCDRLQLAYAQLRRNKRRSRRK